MLGRLGGARYHAAMSKSRTHDGIDRHVIHLMPRLKTAALPGQAPEALRLPRRMGTSGRVSFALLNMIATAGAGWTIHALWTNETPGWWFNAIFTVMTGGLAVALWAILIGSIQEANLERRLQMVWRDIAPSAIAVVGRVTDRHWVLADDGSVASFTLVVQPSDGQPLHGQWRPANSREYLLQPQVPGIGSEARIWRAPDASNETPLVIEVADPTVVS